MFPTPISSAQQPPWVWFRVCFRLWSVLEEMLSVKRVLLMSPPSLRGSRWESWRAVCFTPAHAGAVQNVTAKKIKVTQSWCIFISLLEDQSKCCFFTGEAISNISCKPAFTQTRRHWSFIFVITQAHRCINIISCKGQQVKPKATLSSFVCLLGFLLLMAAVTRAVGNANWH